MDQEELGFNAWILVGNVLNALLRGAPEHAGTLDRARLKVMDEKLEPLQPPQMVEALSTLPAEDRTLLHAACEQAFAVAGTEAATVLGMEKGDAAGVLALLAGAPL